MHWNFFMFLSLSLPEFRKMLGRTLQVQLCYIFSVYAALLLLMRNTEGSTTVDADKEKDVTICPMVIYPW